MLSNLETALVRIEGLDGTSQRTSGAKRTRLREASPANHERFNTGEGLDSALGEARLAKVNAVIR